MRGPTSGHSTPFRAGLFRAIGHEAMPVKQYQPTYEVREVVPLLPLPTRSNPVKTPLEVNVMICRL